MGFLFYEMGVFLFCLGLILVDSKGENGSGRVLIDGKSGIAEVDGDFICATMDWWPPQKCDNGTCSWDHASLLNVDLRNKIFKNAVKAFSPLKIRLGGALQDKVVYQIQNHSKPCNTFIQNTSALFGFNEGCLPLSRWDELNTFIQETRAVATFGLNVLAGKTVLANGSILGAWDSTNSETLMRYTVEKNYTIYGWELGNELSANGIGGNISASQYAIDTKTLGDTLHRVYNTVEPKPRIIAPAGFFDQKWFKEFLDKTPETLDVISHHVYSLGSGVDRNLTEKILDPSYLDEAIDVFRQLKITLKKSLSSASAWVSEAGGAYNSGQNLVSNAFVSSFWYLDQLGISSVYDTKTYCRQSLIGGNYGILNTTTFVPNPDYYSALLWHRLMGRKVLSTSFSGTKKIRAYAHCAKKSKGITLLVMNLDNSTSVDLTLSANGTWSHRQRKTKRVRLEYHLTPKDGNLHSQVVALNGKDLTVSSYGDIPSLEPLYRNASTPITIAPYSIVFIHAPYFTLHACNA